METRKYLPVLIAVFIITMGITGCESLLEGPYGQVEYDFSVAFIPDNGNGEDNDYWLGETAWADGDRYVTRGNWAMYVEYKENGEQVVDLIAGQTMVAGKVHFSTVEGGNLTLTITLNEGWRFADVDENIKIQDYKNKPPARNPPIGRFDHKGYATTSSFLIIVPANNYYGIHVDVEHICL